MQVVMQCNPNSLFMHTHAVKHMLHTYEVKLQEQSFENDNSLIVEQNLSKLRRQVGFDQPVCERMSNNNPTSFWRANGY